MVRRSWRVTALVTGVALTASASALLYLGVREANLASQDLDASLTTDSESASVLLSEFFDRAVGSDLQLAADPAFARFYEAPGSLVTKVEQNIPAIQDAQQSLMAIERTYPGAVSEACFIDLATGRELARVVDGKAAPVDDLSPDESEAAFFAPTKEQPVGVPYQSLPYVSEDTGLWVIATATLVEVGGKPVALAHFEVSIESLRQALVAAGTDTHLRVVDGLSGKVVIDGGIPQEAGGKLGNPDDTTFTGIQMTDAALFDVADERVSSEPLRPGRTLEATNANSTWVVTASAPAIVGGVASSVTPLIVALFALGIPLTVLGLVWAWAARRESKAEDDRVRRERDRLGVRMDELSSALARAASGDLSVTVDVDLGDERMTALAQGFDATLMHLRSLVAQAQASGSRLAQAATELRATAAQQAASASEQSTAVTETTATVEELAATAAQIADTASTVAESASQTLSLTEDGLAAVQDSVSAIGRVTETVESIASSSSALGEKVSEIGRILALIDELSEQTNLLALNAAIEAARAGEHGRGFAVVAAEVRKLAERAQESTSQIQGLVTEIQAYTQNTVRASEAGAREAGHGVEVAGAASEALDRIAQMVDSTTTAVAEISVATQQQRSASDQVVQAMSQVAAMSQEFAAGSQQTASSAAAITELAGEFSTAIEQFDASSGEEPDISPAQADTRQEIPALRGTVGEAGRI
jgi:methyl-accepting chemotaxis protein